MQNKVLILLARKEWRSGRGPDRSRTNNPVRSNSQAARKVNGCRTHELFVFVMRGGGVVYAN
jgi:hypothetical protein